MTEVQEAVKEMVETEGWEFISGLLKTDLSGFIRSLRGAKTIEDMRYIVGKIEGIEHVFARIKEKLQDGGKELPS